MRQQTSIRHPAKDARVNPNDPRTDLPGIQVYDRGGLGCSLFIVALLPYLPLAASTVAEGEFLQLVQSGLLLAVGVWILCVISNYRHAVTAWRSGQPGVATIADKFCYEYDDGEQMQTNYTLVCGFERPDRDGQTQTVQGRYSVPQTVYNDTPIGHTFAYTRVPVKLWGQTLYNAWMLTPPHQWYRRILRWAGVSAAILAVASTAAVWARAAVFAANVRWPALFTSEGAARWWGTLLSSDAVQQMWNTARLIPAVPLTIIASLLVLAGAIWRACQDSGR